MPILPTNFLNNLLNPTDTAALREDPQAAAVSMSDANRQAILDMVSALSPGDTIVGKILYADSENLSLQTREGMTLNAKNGGDITLNPGETVTFEVERTNRKNVTLRPLFQNTTKDQTTIVALRQAGIPVTGRSVEMTARNMQYGLNIDRDSLGASYKDVAAFPESPVKNIVDLQMMKIEVNESNLRQYDAYMNTEHSITSAFNDISLSFADEISKELMEMLPSGELEEIMVNNGLEDGEEALVPEKTVNFTLPSRLMADGTITDSLSDFCEKIMKNESFSQVDVSEGEINVLKESLNANSIKSANLDAISLTDSLTTPANALSAYLKDILEGVKAFNNVDYNNLSNEASVNLLEKLEGFKDIINSKVIENLTNRTFSSQWSLDRSKISSKQEISNLYDRLFEQVRDLTGLMKNNITVNDNIMNAVNNLSENVNFMENLNNFVPYVQIPFHNGDNNNTGELYVFSNKKNLSRGDGEISAFIHLDMKNIGPTDVYVKLSGTDRLSTQFTLRDDEVLDLVASHLDFLENRLKEKGYNVDVSMKKMEGGKSAIETALENNTHKILLSSTSFDARV